MGIGHAGMILGAKVLAEAGYIFLARPDVLDKAWHEFRERTGGREYVCAMSPDQKPPFHMYEQRP